ncbi:M36 family metallopeptidase [Actinoplanes sp. NPDC049599]|uniref:M36 family metallopeptidase n=1 Tax=Actinoplanes sp. NPDC049599 TaxID=3363903 RepID=UPI0037B36A71
MSREFDLRRPVEPGDEQRYASLAREVSDGLDGGHTVRVTAVDPLTGNPCRIESVGAAPEPGDPRTRALAHLRSVGPLLGLTAAQPVEFVGDPVVRTTGSGAHAVHLRQQYQGIPVFQAAQAVVFDPTGAVASTAGSCVTIGEPLDVAPAVRAEDAVLAAARRVARPTADELGTYDQFMEPFDAPTADLTSFEPRAVAVIAGAPDRTTVLEPGPFAEPITAGLVWFPLRPGDLRLGWKVTLTMPGHAQRFVVVADAGDAGVLFAHQVTLSAAATADVFLAGGDGERHRITLPRPLSDYPVEPPPDLPVGFPGPWLAGDDTAGTNVVAGSGVDGPAVRGQRDGDQLVFAPAPDSAEQWVVNAFALASSAHDFFALLGLTEAAGDLTGAAPTRAAAPPVGVRVFAEPLPGTATMLTPVNGAGPVLRLGPVGRTGRHTALDPTVVFHEYAHVVTQRLAGGVLDVHALDEPQSAGMGEGWSDYFACVQAGTEVVAAWAVDRPEGIRTRPYDEQYPGVFDQLGAWYSTPHEVGELWCATLMAMTRRLGSPGLAARLVLDAITIARANPSFLDMRDAILTALAFLRTAGRLSAEPAAAAERAVWEAFAHFGMGPAATCRGARLEGIKADHSVPPPAAAPAPRPAPERAACALHMITVVLGADGEIREHRIVQVDDALPEQAPVRTDGGRRIQYFVETPQPPSEPTPGRPRLSIMDLRFEVPAEPDRLVATITFALTGPGADALAAAGAGYLAHIVVTSADPPWTRVAATAAGRFGPGRTAAEAALEFGLPEPGRYQLVGGVLAPPGETLALAAGPVLHVVP